MLEVDRKKESPPRKRWIRFSDLRWSKPTWAVYEGSRISRTGSGMAGKGPSARNGCGELGGKIARGPIMPGLDVTASGIVLV